MPPRLIALGVTSDSGLFAARTAMERGCGLGRYLPSDRDLIALYACRRANLAWLVSSGYSDEVAYK